MLGTVTQVHFLEIRAGIILLRSQYHLLKSKSAIVVTVTPPITSFHLMNSASKDEKTVCFYSVDGSNDRRTVEFSREGFQRYLYPFYSPRLHCSVIIACKEFYLFFREAVFAG